MSIQLIVGLGNPQLHLAECRHNAGFWLMDRLAEQSWIPESDCLLSDYKGISLVKPFSGINLSGIPLSRVVLERGISPQNILLVYDDLDIPCGQVKFKRSCKSRHNGVRNVIEHLGTADFAHLRIGIGKSRSNRLLDYVLSAPSDEERVAINHALNRVQFLLPTLWVNEADFVKRLHTLKP